MTSSLITSRQAPTPPTNNNTRENWQEIIRYLVKAGAQAPSWYNCQPWTFKVTDNQIELILDEAADSSFYDWQNTNSLLACGAALENILIAARGRGIDTQVASFPEPSEPWLLARITLSQEASEANSYLENEIWTRHTNSLMFEKDELDEETRDTLNHSITSFADTSLHLLSSGEEKQKVFNAVSCAEQVRFSRQDLHEYLHRMIRWSDADAVDEPTGYTLPSMGACGIGKSFFRLTRSWHVMHMMNFFGAYKDQAKRANLGLLNSSAIGLITIKGNTTNSKLLTAGQALERLWLTATHLGLDLQPHTTITLFHLVWQSDKPKLFTASEQKTLSKAFQLYSQAFPSVDFNDKENGVFLFRVGKGPPVYGFTQRKPVAQWL